jgi:hypothetical protein
VVDLLSAIAKRKKATPAQIALAWLLAQKPWIVPIPGTRKLERMVENIGAAEIELTSADLREIESAFSEIKVHGARLSEDLRHRRRAASHEAAESRAHHQGLLGGRPQGCPAAWFTARPSMPCARCLKDCARK